MFTNPFQTVLKSPLAPIFGGGAGVPEVKMLAHRVYGPGYNSGAALPTGDGTQKTHVATHNNILGIPLEKVSIVLQGWSMRTTGVSDVTNPFTVDAQIEYPSGTVIGSATGLVVPANGANKGLVESPEISLTAPIPPGATMVIRLFSTVPLNDKYVVNLGWAGLRVHTKQAALLPKVALMAVGDSIMTNNNGAVYNALNGRCPGYHNSVTGTRASHYGANNAEAFQRQCDLAQALGLTDIISDFGTNDFGAAATLAELQGWLLAMKTAANARGVRFNQCTMLPRVFERGAVTATSVTRVGNVMTVGLADTSLFLEGMPYSIAGADQADYNGPKICTGVTATTVTFFVPGTPVTPATGTITLSSWKDTVQAEWQAPFTSKYEPGPASDRGLFNAWVRGGAFDDYLEWADAVEPFRDSGRFMVADESPLLPSLQQITVSSVINTSRFNSNYNRGSSTMANGFIQVKTGNNIGVYRAGNGNTNGDITVSSAFPVAQVVGDVYYAVPGVSYMSDDGTHLRVSTGGKGGQIHLDNATAAWIDAKLAA